MVERKRTKDKQRSTKHTHKTKDRVTGTRLKTGGELRCSGKLIYGVLVAIIKLSNNLNKAEMNQIISVSTTCLYICRWKTCVFISQLTYSQSKSRENSYNTIKPAYAFTDIEQSPVFKGNIFLSCQKCNIFFNHLLTSLLSRFLSFLTLLLLLIN
jgi:hypothetical protein